MTNKIQAKHILVEKKSLAEAIIEEINNGINFEEMAKKHSTCPSKKRGGNLGEFGRGQIKAPLIGPLYRLSMRLTHVGDSLWGADVIHHGKRKEVCHVCADPIAYGFHGG